MLITLPDITWPVTKEQANTLMVDVQQLNILEGGLSEPSQRGLGIYFHTFDLWVKSKGKIDYRGVDGHRRLVEDAMRFVGTGNPVATKHGDIAAAHLSLDWHDTQMRLKEGHHAPISSRVGDLLHESRELAALSIEMEKRTGLLLDYLGKRPLIP